jgi:hypothetical protein
MPDIKGIKGTTFEQGYNKAVEDCQIYLTKKPLVQLQNTRKKTGRQDVMPKTVLSLSFESGKNKEGKRKRRVLLPPTPD